MQMVASFGSETSSILASRRMANLPRFTATPFHDRQSFNLTRSQQRQFNRTGNVGCRNESGLAFGTKGTSDSDPYRKSVGPIWPSTVGRYRSHSPDRMPRGSIPRCEAT